MGSFVWMKVLESAPERYDRGIQMLSGDHIGEVYARVAELGAGPGARVLDIGCGTGGVSLCCAAREATVTGVDFDAGMLEVARFPLWERLEMAAMWGVSMLAVALPIAGVVAGRPTAAVTDAAVATMVGGMFALLPWLHIRTRARYLTFAAFALAAASLGVGALQLLGLWSLGHGLALGLTCLVAMGVLSVDLAGTTPWYASYVNSANDSPHIELVQARCTGAADCVQVCPRDVLQMDGPRRKVVIERPEQCIRCGACIVQCPEDALRFRYDDGRVVEADSIRTTRMNMLGRRTVQVSSGSEDD